MELLPKAGVLSPPPGDEVTAGAPSASAFPLEILALWGLGCAPHLQGEPPRRTGVAIPRRRGGVLSWEG